MQVKFGCSFTLNLGLSDSRIPLKLQWIENGTFLMGSSENELWRDAYYSRPLREITLSHGFWIGQFPITQAQWQTTMQCLPAVSRKHSDCPIEIVNWYQALSFCETLNAQFIDELPEGYIFSLPTNAQWEYVCRAGSTTTFYSGDSLEALSRIAWFSANSNNQLQPVGAKEPNAWGVYDMIGNVGEWCYDEANEAPKTPQVDWIAEGPLYVPLRFVRNGSYLERPEDGIFNCSFYIDHFARRPSQGVGFRICLRQVYDTLYK